jgi:hypothetical protein
MSNPTTSTTAITSTPSGLQQVLIAPARYDNTPQFLPSVPAVQGSPSTHYDAPSLSNLPYPAHRERNIATPARPTITSTDTIPLEKDGATNTNTLLPTVGPELLNHEVIVSNQQPVVSEATQDGDNSNALVPGSKSGQTYVDITEYLNMPQSEAAKKLGIPTSTLSKRWKEAVRGRKWPYRMICKLDKEIMTLLHNVPQGANGNGVTPPFPEDMENTLTRLIRLRNEELKSVVIRI